MDNNFTTPEIILNKISELTEKFKNLNFTDITPDEAKEILGGEVEGYDLEEGELFINSCKCAVYAKQLAEICNYPNPQLAFMAAFYRDIGKLVLDKFVGENYNKIYVLVCNGDISFLEAEKSVLGVNHCEAGMVLAERLNFPKTIVDVIKFHHSPEQSKALQPNDIELIIIVHVADYVTMKSGCGTGNDGMMYKIESDAFEYIKMKSDPMVIEKIINEMDELNFALLDIMKIIKS